MTTIQVTMILAQQFLHWLRSKDGVWQELICNIIILNCEIKHFSFSSLTLCYTRGVHSFCQEGHMWWTSTGDRPRDVHCSHLTVGHIPFILWIKPRGPVKIRSRAAFGTRAGLWTYLSYTLYYRRDIVERDQKNSTDHCLPKLIIDYSFQHKTWKFNVWQFFFIISPLDHQQIYLKLGWPTISQTKYAIHIECYAM